MSGQLQKSDALTASDSAKARFNDAAANLNNLAVQKDKASAAVNSLTAQYEALADKQSEEALSVKRLWTPPPRTSRTSSRR